MSNGARAHPYFYALLARCFACLHACLTGEQCLYARPRVVRECACVCVCVCVCSVGSSHDPHAHRASIKTLRWHTLQETWSVRPGQGKATHTSTHTHTHTQAHTYTQARSITVTCTSCGLQHHHCFHTRCQYKKACVCVCVCVYTQVANEVEVEQILDVGVDPCSGLPLISSVVQVSETHTQKKHTGTHTCHRTATHIIRGAGQSHTHTHTHMHIRHPIHGLWLDYSTVLLVWVQSRPYYCSPR